MEVLQWIVNVTGITGVTGLLMICCLLKRDNRALAAEVRSLRQRQGKTNAAIEQTPQGVGNADIRQYVARRMESWSALSGPAPR